MEQQFILMIIDIQEELKDKCIIVASDFAKTHRNASMLQGVVGKKWNKYVNKNCAKYNFEIWKNKKDQNFYVNATTECSDKATSMKLTPHSTNKILRGVDRTIEDK